MPSLLQPLLDCFFFVLRKLFIKKLKIHLTIIAMPVSCLWEDDIDILVSVLQLELVSTAEDPAGPPAAMLQRNFGIK